jgi:microcompartment protein CcmL/EutN
MTLIAVLLGQMMKLTRDNSFHAADAVGKVAEVYLRVPPAKSDTGKVMVSVNGSMHELEAMTLETEALPTGMRVRVVAALDGDVVLVQSLG